MTEDAVSVSNIASAQVGTSNVSDVSDSWFASFDFMTLVYILLGLVALFIVFRVVVYIIRGIKRQGEVNSLQKDLMVRRVLSKLSRGGRDSDKAKSELNLKLSLIDLAFKQGQEFINQQKHLGSKKSWFIVLGEPSCGKTTLIEQSNMGLQCAQEHERTTFVSSPTTATTLTPTAPTASSAASSASALVSATAIGQVAPSFVAPAGTLTSVAGSNAGAVQGASFHSTFPGQSAQLAQSSHSGETNVAGGMSGNLGTGMGVDSDLDANAGLGAGTGAGSGNGAGAAELGSNLGGGLDNLSSSSLGNVTRPDAASPAVQFYVGHSQVLLDVSGEVFFDHWAGGSSAEYTHICQLINKKHHSEPLRGIVLCIPADALLADDSKLTQKKALLMLEELWRLTSTLNQYLPCYIVITKLDVVLGFREYFASQSDELKDQALGMLTPPWEIEYFLTELQAKLQAGAYSLFTSKEVFDLTYQGKSRLDKSAGIYLFAQNFAKLQNNLFLYLNTIFAPQSKNFAFFRGLFFTSSQDDGYCLDSDFAHLAHQSMDDVPFIDINYRSSRAYFVKGALECVFKDPACNHFNHKAQLRRDIPRYMAVTASSALIAFFLHGVLFAAPHLKQVLATEVLYYRSLDQLFKSQVIDNAPLLATDSSAQGFTLFDMPMPHDSTTSRLSFFSENQNHMRHTFSLPLSLMPGAICSFNLDFGADKAERGFIYNQLQTRMVYLPLVRGVEQSFILNRQTLTTERRNALFALMAIALYRDLNSYTQINDSYVPDQAKAMLRYQYPNLTNNIRNELLYFLPQYDWYSNATNDEIILDANYAQACRLGLGDWLKHWQDLSNYPDSNYQQIKIDIRAATRLNHAYKQLLSLSQQDLHTILNAMATTKDISPISNSISSQERYDLSSTQARPGVISQGTSFSSNNTNMGMSRGQGQVTSQSTGQDMSQDLGQRAVASGGTGLGSGAGAGTDIGAMADNETASGAGIIAGTKTTGSNVGYGHSGLKGDALERARLAMEGKFIVSYQALSQLNAQNQKLIQSILDDAKELDHLIGLLWSEYQQQQMMAGQNVEKHSLFNKAASQLTNSEYITQVPTNFKGGMGTAYTSVAVPNLNQGSQSILGSTFGSKAHSLDSDLGSNMNSGLGASMDLATTAVGSDGTVKLQSVVQTFMIDQAYVDLLSRLRYDFAFLNYFDHTRKTKLQQATSIYFGDIDFSYLMRQQPKLEQALNDEYQALKADYIALQNSPLFAPSAVMPNQRTNNSDKSNGSTTSGKTVVSSLDLKGIGDLVDGNMGVISDIGGIDSISGLTLDPTYHLTPSYVAVTTVTPTQNHKEAPTAESYVVQGTAVVKINESATTEGNGVGIFQGALAVKGNALAPAENSGISLAHSEGTGNGYKSDVTQSNGVRVAQGAGADKSWGGWLNSWSNFSLIETAHASNEVGPFASASLRNGQAHADAQVSELMHNYKLNYLVLADFLSLCQLPPELVDFEQKLANCETLEQTFESFIKQRALLEAQQHKLQEFVTRYADNPFVQSLAPVGHRIVNLNQQAFTIASYDKLLTFYPQGNSATQIMGQLSAQLAQLPFGLDAQHPVYPFEYDEVLSSNLKLRPEYNPGPFIAYLKPLSYINHWLALNTSYVDVKLDPSAKGASTSGHQGQGTGMNAGLSSAVAMGVSGNGAGSGAGSRDKVALRILSTQTGNVVLGEDVFLVYQHIQQNQQLAMLQTVFSSYAGAMIDYYAKMADHVQPRLGSYEQFHELALNSRAYEINDKLHSLYELSYNTLAALNDDMLQSQDVAAKQQALKHLEQRLSEFSVKLNDNCATSLNTWSLLPADALSASALIESSPELSNQLFTQSKGLPWWQSFEAQGRKLLQSAAVEQGTLTVDTLMDRLNAFPTAKDGLPEQALDLAELNSLYAAFKFLGLKPQDDPLAALQGQAGRSSTGLDGISGAAQQLPGLIKSPSVKQQIIKSSALSAHFLNNIENVLSILCAKHQMGFELFVPNAAKQNQLYKSMSFNLPLATLTYRYISAQGEGVLQNGARISSAQSQNRKLFSGLVFDQALTLSFYEYSSDVKAQAQFTLYHYPALQMYLNPSTLYDEKAHQAYVPLTITSKKGSYVFFIGLQFDKDIPSPENWPSSVDFKTR